MSEYLMMLLFVLCFLVFAVVWSFVTVNVANALRVRWEKGKRWPTYLTLGLFFGAFIFGFPALLTLA